jgi:hypothetical protein
MSSGVLLAQGGRFGGWSLYLKDGNPAYVYNWVGLERYTVAAPETLRPGKAVIRMDLTYDGGGRDKGGTTTLSIDGRKVAEGRIANTTANVFSGDETADVGVDEATPVTEDYKERENRFTGRIHRHRGTTESGAVAGAKNDSTGDLRAEDRAERRSAPGQPHSDRGGTHASRPSER